MNKNVWETIWDYDPNGLLVIDENYKIQLVNSAFTKLFNLESEDILGRFVLDFFDNIDDFIEINQEEKEMMKETKEYPEINKIMSEIIFKIKDKGIIVKIFNDITEEREKEKKNKDLKFKIADDVQKIIEKQMKTGQEIASILGETTAETKAKLVKLQEILKKES